MTRATDRRLDLLVFGATSFVGQILCRYLVERHGTDGSLRWAIAGRNRTKLDSVAHDTGAEVERIVADASDGAALADMASSTKVVVSTVGPYALYGSELVAAVVEAGTDYCDLTGEPQWIRRMIDAHSVGAESSGSRVVNSCGFDSIPSDLGVWFTQQRSLETHGEYCDLISMRVKALRGGASGGTIASMVNLMAEASEDSALRELLADPFALVPDSIRRGVPQPQHKGPFNDSLSGQWAAPFVMEAINTRIVMRTNALLDKRWGSGFRYDEAMLMGSGPLGMAKATGVSAGLAGAMFATSIGPIRNVLSDRVLPKPGTGPSADAQQRGYFDLRFFGSAPSGDRIRTRVIGDRDPGYGSTARMLGEAAFALVDGVAPDSGGGFWTPAALFGDELVERLDTHAGVGFEVID